MRMPGHNPPLLLLAGSNDFVRLMPTGVALGAASDQAYGEAQVTILPGDLLVLYTDGVTEAINSKDEEFSEAKLMETILRVRGRPSQEIIREIRDGIREHAGEEPQFDDITLMVLKGV